MADVIETPNRNDKIMSQPIGRRLRDDLLYRLRWDIFGPLSDILVVQEPGSPDTTLAAFSDHPIASQLLAEPPVNKISVVIDSCEEKAVLDEDDEECRYQPPVPAVIENAHGITLKDFVTKTHAYLNANHEQIYKCEDESYSQPEDLGNGVKCYSVRLDDQSGDGEHFFRGGNIPEGAKFWFKYASGYTLEEGEANEGNYQVSIWVYVDGDRGKSREKHWEQMDRHCAAAVQRRSDESRFHAYKGRRMDS